MATFLNVAPGNGTIYGLQQQAKAENKQFMDVRLSMCDVEDIFNPAYPNKPLPAWIAKANSQPTVLVFDEYQRVLSEVKSLVDNLATENKFVDSTGKTVVENVFNSNVEVYVVNLV